MHSWPCWHPAYRACHSRPRSRSCYSTSSPEVTCSICKSGMNWRFWLFCWPWLPLAPRSRPRKLLARQLPGNVSWKVRRMEPRRNHDCHCSRWDSCSSQSCACSCDRPSPSSVCRPSAVLDPPAMSCSYRPECLLHRTGLGAGRVPNSWGQQGSGVHEPWW